MFLDTVHNLLTNGATYLAGCSYGHNYPTKQELAVMTHTQMDMLSSSVRGAYEMIKANIMDNVKKQKTKAMKESCEFTFFGQSWKCARTTRSDDSFGGECDSSKWLISINSSYDDETFLDYLHHELIEGATYVMNCDYTKCYPDRDELFVFDYKGLEVLSSAVRGAYEEIKEKMGAINGWIAPKATAENTITKHKKAARH